MAKKEKSDKKVEELKKQKRQLTIELVIQILAYALLLLLVAGFAVSLFHLMGAASTAGILRYGFATVAFAVLLPSFAVSYKRKS